MPGFNPGEAAPHAGSNPHPRSNKVAKMGDFLAKKLYSVGFHRVKTFIQENRSIIKEHLTKPSLFEYSKIFGNAIYELKIKEFLETFKIHKQISYSLEIISYFKSLSFVEKTIENIGANSLAADFPKIDKRALLYVIVYVLSEKSNDIEIERSLFPIFDTKPPPNPLFMAKCKNYLHRFSQQYLFDWF